MNSNLTFDFSVDTTNNQIKITREFAAEQSLVWSAWTEAEILDQWWAPKPWVSKTKHMDFTEGGTRLYAMCGPEGDEHWGITQFLKISPKDSFTGTDAFSDQDGVVNPEFPQSSFEVVFKAHGEHTLVENTTTYQNLAQLEATIQMGFKEGMTMALENLDAYFLQQQKLRRALKTDGKARVVTYLNFPGNTEEAFNFYRSVFGTEFSGKGIQRFGDIPKSDNQPEIAESIKKMILHVELPILNGHVLMATDAPEEMGFKLESGNTMHISVEPETREETERLFAELSADGTITMPLEEMFFGALFGSFTDKFGINWMVNYQLNND